MPAPDTDCRIELFESALGWMALAVADGHVRQLVFAHKTSDACLSDLHRALAAADVEPHRKPAPRSRDDDRRLAQRLAQRLRAYADGRIDDFLDVPVELGPQRPFSSQVIAQCRQIPYGSRRTYGELAALAGSPRAARAVGNCMRSNPVPLIVPCHRVVGGAGDLRGYSAGEGVRMKIRLLEMESLASCSANEGAICDVS